MTAPKPRRSARSLAWPVARELLRLLPALLALALSGVCLQHTPERPPAVLAQGAP
jgi:hypothetical protein